VTDAAALPGRADADGQHPGLAQLGCGFGRLLRGYQCVGQVDV
jgi:hypothetical protein